MSETTCPKCGSQYTRMRKTLDDDWSEKYRCGTALYVDENGNRRWDQSLDCMFREKELQLAALQAELTATRAERDIRTDALRSIAIIARGTRPECPEFVRDHVLLALDNYEWLAEDVSRYESEATIRFNLCGEVEQLKAERDRLRAAADQGRFALTLAMVDEKQRDDNAGKIVVLETAIDSLAAALSAASRDQTK